MWGLVRLYDSAAREIQAELRFAAPADLSQQPLAVDIQFHELLGPELFGKGDAEAADGQVASQDRAANWFARFTLGGVDRCRGDAAKIRTREVPGGDSAGSLLSKTANNLSAI